jgi:hypothetical protein
MILSSAYNLIESPSTDSDRVFLHFLDCELISESDTHTGLFQEGTDRVFLQPSNWPPLKRFEYNLVADAPLRSKNGEAEPSFDSVLNRTLTLTELHKLGLLSEEEVASRNTYAVIRNPIDRLMNLFFRACNRRGVDEFASRSLFDEFMSGNGMIHHLWKDQWHYHSFYGETVAKPILYEALLNQTNMRLSQDFGVARFSSKQMMILSEEVRHHEWYSQEGLSRRYRFMLEDRYARDFELWSTEFNRVFKQ